MLVFPQLPCDLRKSPAPHPPVELACVHPTVSLDLSIGLAPTPSKLPVGRPEIQHGPP
jgi:hypothetical protein